MPTYDRSGLIQRAIDNLTGRLVEEFLIVALVCLAFLLHLRSSLVVILSLPVGILAAFVVMHWQGINANIMSLGGIAIAIGAMVDAAIVMIENLHKHIEREPLTAPTAGTLVARGRRRGGAGALLLAAHHHPELPAGVRPAGAGGAAVRAARLHQDLRHGGGRRLSITLVPVLMGSLVRGRIRPEQDNPLNRGLMRAYRPLLDWVLRGRGWCWCGASC